MTWVTCTYCFQNYQKEDAINGFCPHCGVGLVEEDA